MKIPFNVLYSGFKLLPQEGQPDVDLNNFFIRMADGGTFLFTPYYSDSEEPTITYTSPEEFRMVITEVRAGEKCGELFITGRTIGILPEGIKHGQYKFLLTGDADIASNLPNELFEDSSVDKTDILSTWKRHVEEAVKG